MSKYIIGGGIAGLIFAFYNPEYKIITDKIGGQMKAGFAGPRLLEYNKYSEAFLADLNIDAEIKIAKVGYRVNNSNCSSISSELRKQYYIKSRCLKNYDINSVPDSIMSDGKSELKYFDIDWDELISKLNEKVFSSIMLANVESIDTTNKSIFIKNKQYRNGKNLEFDNIVSTIPAPIFFKISDIKNSSNLEYVQKVFILLSNNLIDLDIASYDYMYFPEDKYEFHRISKIGHNRICLEYTLNYHFKRIIDQWAKYDISTKHIVMPIGQIQSGKVDKIKDVDFIGRYAEWNHDIKVDDIIKICKEGSYVRK